ncbi:ferritin-like domain-containing protein [Chitinimonas sp.]|uniref:ferritin-like domain-containing protein n=1 Tax=Chitinimonas sp. TaxID=1934313 RepID=UPI0035AF1F7D
MTPAHHREQLNNMLCEAAEIEHSLMCTYLYAAFSVKQSTAEDLSEEEFAAVQRWRREIIAVAVDEMLHLSLVSNLIACIGERPHYRRFNFPISSGLFPADVAVALAPLDMATLDHFVYLERPHSVEERDAARYEKSSFKRVLPTGRLMAFSDDYTTVGELYQCILDSFRYLVNEYGEEAVFVGRGDTQLSMREFALDGLHPVLNLADVESVINRIVSQGEGSTESVAGSHYGRFCAIRQEWRAFEAARPDFRPARPVAENPIMRSQVAAGARVHIVAEPAASLLDLGNACYGLMLRLLGLMNDRWLVQAQIRPAVARQSLTMMHAVTEIATLLTGLPANPEHPGVNAGLTFTVSRAALSFVDPASACSVLGERNAAIAERLQRFAADFPSLQALADTLNGFASAWRDWGAALHGAGETVAPLPAAVAPSQPAAAPAPASGKVETAHCDAATVSFDHGRCIHARQCVMGEPGVFVANKPGEWIYPAEASAERLVRIAIACPSGAIQVTRHDGGDDETAPLVNQIRVRENGPLAVHGELNTAGNSDGYRATLCRCGQSQNKPYCDGSHGPAGFTASGEPATRPSEPLPVRNGMLQLRPQKNGPLLVLGNTEILSGTGRTVDRLSETRLCRCGQSKNKPFCDNSHLAAGFVADGE